MKAGRIFLGVALIGAGFITSCVESVVEDMMIEKQEIVFSHLNDKVTRGEGGFCWTGANSTHDDYKILAATSLSSDKWYIEDEVSGEGLALNKPKRGPYYWLGGGTQFSFYAYAPAVFASSESQSRTCVRGDTRASDGLGVVIDYKVPHSASEDFTVANPVKQTSFHVSGGAVNLNFKHMLSKVTVIARLSDDLKRAGYALNEDYTVELTVRKNSGTVDPTAESPVWLSVDTDPRSALAYRGKTSYLIMPQEAMGCSVQLQNIIITKGGIQLFPRNGKEGSLKCYTLQAGDVKVTEKTEEPDHFLMGKHYQLTFTVNQFSTDAEEDAIWGKEIIFQATTADFES